jgi:hypothetical protein
MLLLSSFLPESLQSLKLLETKALDKQLLESQTLQPSCSELCSFQKKSCSEELGILPTPIQGVPNPLRKQGVDVVGNEYVTTIRTNSIIRLLVCE